MDRTVAAQAAIDVVRIPQVGVGLLCQAGGNGVGDAHGLVVGGVRDDDRPVDAVVRHHRAEEARERLATGVEATGEAVVGECGLQQGQAGGSDGDRGSQCRGGDHPGAEAVAAQMDAQLRPLAADLVQQMAEAGADRPGPRLHLVIGRVVHEPFGGSDDPGREIG